MLMKSTRTCLCSSADAARLFGGLDFCGGQAELAVRATAQRLDRLALGVRRHICRWGKIIEIVSAGASVCDRHMSVRLCAGVYGEMLIRQVAPGCGMAHGVISLIIPPSASGACQLNSLPALMGPSR